MEQQWYFSIIDVVELLTNSTNPRDYWFKMKIRVRTEGGFELSTICRQFKMKATDVKMSATDVADVQTLLRIIQSIPPPKAEPFKQWLSKVGYERMKEIADPAQSLDRSRENYPFIFQKSLFYQFCSSGLNSKIVLSKRNFFFPAIAILGN
jgi:DNA-damage-inducible protein D